MPYLKSLFQAQKDSQLEAKEFIKKYQNELNKIRIGCSFKPENFSDEERNSGYALKALKICVEDLGIRNIRIGIRWDHVVEKEEDEISFNFYRPYLDYCLKKKVNITLNIGPIKVINWPEVHIPAYVFQRFQRPKSKCKIDLDNMLSTLALDYLKRFLKKLKKEYDFKLINTIQADNEPFFNFGMDKWIFGKDYLTKTYKLINEFFPQKNILITSSGRGDLKKIITTIKDLNFIKKIIIGYNYYYKLPNLEKYPLINKFDNLILTNYFSFSTQKLKKLSQKMGFKIEVSEAQGEPWTVSSPGNSANEFKFVILRSIREMIDLNMNSKSIIRYWGIEVFTRKILNRNLNKNHKEIIYLISKINK